MCSGEHFYYTIFPFINGDIADNEVHGKTAVTEVQMLKMKLSIIKEENTS